LNNKTKQKKIQQITSNIANKGQDKFEEINEQQAIQDPGVQGHSKLSPIKKEEQNGQTGQVPEIGIKVDINAINQQETRMNIVTQDYKNLLFKLIESETGLYNAGGSCYMASIIQILIHLKKKIDIFLQKKFRNNSPLSNLFYNFIEKIVNSKIYSIEIKNFAKEYNKINSKFSGKHGNNPMTFFNEFIKKLNEENKENNSILNLFLGKKYINFNGMEDLNYSEDFIFYLIALDKKNIFI